MGNSAWFKDTYNNIHMYSPGFAWKRSWVVMRGQSRSSQNICHNEAFFNRNVLLDFVWFWRWCIAHRITGFLDLLHRPVFWGVETRRFRNWICFRPKVKGGEGTYTVGTLCTSGRCYRSSQFFLVSLHWCSYALFCWLCLQHEFQPPFLSQFYACACFITAFIIDFLVISRIISLVSSD
jgi:hypothetical protein